mmetsp:Transcript_67651/g.220235  ORF Transcript_67651/g.220235 Transcript_67651/m.220235 type:complete len:231 (-) Transcript_67651:5373-6065(-)
MQVVLLAERQQRLHVIHHLRGFLILVAGGLCQQCGPKPHGFSGATLAQPPQRHTLQGPRAAPGQHLLDELHELRGLGHGLPEQRQVVLEERAILEDEHIRQQFRERRPALLPELGRLREPSDGPPGHRTAADAGAAGLGAASARGEQELDEVRAGLPRDFHLVDDAIGDLVAHTIVFAVPLRNAELPILHTAKVQEDTVLFGGVRHDTTDLRAHHHICSKDTAAVCPTSV